MGELAFIILLFLFIAALVALLGLQENKNQPSRQRHSDDHSNEQIPTIPSLGVTQLLHESNATVSDKATKAEDNSQTEELTEAVGEYAWRNMAFAGIVAASTAAQFVLGVLLWWVTSGQLEVMQFGQRAWLNIGLPGATRGDTEDEIIAAITVENTGNCPATITYADYQFVNGDSLDDISDEVRAIESAPSAGKNVRQMAVAPKWDFRERVPGFGFVVRRKLYLVCHIRYSDMFGDTYRSQWCFQYGENAKGEPKFSTSLRYNYMK